MADDLDLLQTALAGHYRIERELGRGGYAHVYLAEDLKHHRSVAIKVLRSDLSAQLGSERFLREIEITGKLTHPHIIPLFDSGSADGLLYLVMPYVDGESVRARLKRERQLPIDDALQITREVADAVDYAHREGVIHRDLKPENVLLEQHHAVVADFGIARALHRAGSESLTTSGLVIGTTTYMSPEQASSQELDGRTDQYGLACMAYEMLGGQPPFTGPTDESILYQHMSVDAPPVTNLRHTISTDVARVIQRGLAKVPADRFRTATDLSNALSSAAEKSVELTANPEPPPDHNETAMWPRWRRRLSLVALAAVLSVVSVAAYMAVNRSTEERSPGWTFYERGLHYLREEAETSESLHSATQMFHRSLSADSGLVVAWAGLGEAYWRTFELTRDLLPRMEAESAVERALAHDPNLPEALNAKARGLLAIGEFREAKEVFQQVTRAEPTMDVAWANLGRAHLGLGEYQEAYSALSRAIELKPTSFQHQIYLGNFYQQFREHDEAEKAYRRAIELKPESPIAWQNLGAALLHKGELQPAAEALHRSIDISERAPAVTNLGTVYYFLGQYEDAVSWYRLATELTPEDATTWGNLGDGLRMHGNAAAARHAYRVAAQCAKRAVELAPDEPLLLIRSALWCARAGNTTDALKKAAQAAEMQPDDAHILFRSAVIHCIAGEEEKALDWLEQAVKLGLGRAEIESEPDLAKLQSSPQYQRILQLAS